MASLREIAREYKDEIMSGIAWVAIWKTGRSWNARAFWLNPDAEKIECEEMEEARAIVAADENAIFINEYYTAHMGEGKLEEIRHTIQVFDGCAEEIAEYECKEDCLIVLYAIFKAIEQGGKTAELPTQEKMKEQREALKQYLESGKKLTEWTAELLKELLDM